jgi:hypothetical protein
LAIDKNFARYNQDSGFVEADLKFLGLERQTCKALTDKEEYFRPKDCKLIFKILFNY